MAEKPDYGNRAGQTHSPPKSESPGQNEGCFDALLVRGSRLRGNDGFPKVRMRLPQVIGPFRGNVQQSYPVAVALAFTAGELPSSTFAGGCGPFLRTEVTWCMWLRISRYDLNVPVS